MKTRGTIILLAFILVVASCKKDNNNPPSYEGSWVNNSFEIDLLTDSAYVASNNGLRTGAGIYAVSGNRITFNDYESFCPSGQTGIYTFSISNTTINGTPATYMQLNLVSDSCSYRATNFPGQYQEF